MKPSRTLIVSFVVAGLVLHPARSADAPADKSHVVKSIELTLVRIEPGEFLMGSPEGEASRDDDEAQHRVRLTKPYYLQVTEVTQRQFKAVLGDKSNRSSFQGDDLPVENVSWTDAMAFCAELSRLEGRRFRLPTEAEWEYAARAGKEGPVAGTGKLAEMAWHADNSGKRPPDSAAIWDATPNDYFTKLHDNGCRPRAVGTGVANDWGLHDMQGNVAEWVADWHEDLPNVVAGARTDPPGPRKSSLGSRVMRGGSWGSDPRNCRLASRDYNVPTTRTGSCGFRIMMEVE